MELHSPAVVDTPAPPTRKSNKKRPRYLHEARRDKQSGGVTLLSQPSDRKLDSVVLQWYLHNDKVRSLPAEKLIDIFMQESIRFKDMSRKKCQKAMPKLRNAFEMVVTNTMELATIKAIEDPYKLRDAWLDVVALASQAVLRKEKAARTFGRNSVVGNLLGTIKTPSPSKSAEHPRGGLRVRPPKAKKSVTFDVDSSTDQDGSAEYSVSSSEEEAIAPTKKAKEQRPPLKIDTAAEEGLRSLRSMKNVRELSARAVDWITDTFVNGSTHVRQIVAGRHRDLDWSRSQLSRVGERIIALYDQVAMRERMGDRVAASAREDLLASEWRAFANIRLSLHIIRLGEAGASSFHQKVEDDGARADFELTSGNPRAFKIFAKELAAAQKAKSTATSRSIPNRGRPSAMILSSAERRMRRYHKQRRLGVRRGGTKRRFRSHSRDRTRGTRPPRRGSGGGGSKSKRPRN